MLLDERLELVPVPDVARATGGFESLRPQTRDDLVAGFGLAADHDDLGAGGCERAHHGEAEAARAARHDRDASGQVEQVTRVPEAAGRAGAVTRILQSDQLLGRGWMFLGRSEVVALVWFRRPVCSGSENHAFP